MAERFAAVVSGKAQLDLYEPAVTVEGDAAAGPLQRDPTLLDAEAAPVRSAVAYAEARGRGALLVLHRNRIVLERYFGDAQPTTRFDSLSMHKTLVALLVGQAIAAREMPRVETRAVKLLPEWREDARREIRIVDLLRMNGGIERQRLAAGPPFNLETRMLFGDDVWGAALARALQVPPGVEFHYNNVETQLLGIALERSTRTSYAQYLSRRLWKPLGARDAVLWADSSGRVRTYCCLLATAEDWVRVGRLFLREGRLEDGRALVPRGWMRQMTAASPLNPAYGYQLWRGVEPARASRAGTGSMVDWTRPLAASDVIILMGFGGQRTYISRELDLVIVRIGAQTQQWSESELFNAIAARVDRRGRSARAPGPASGASRY